MPLPRFRIRTLMIAVAAAGAALAGPSARCAALCGVGTGAAFMLLGCKVREAWLVGLVVAAIALGSMTP
jgi:hypothetical protein